MLQCKPDRFIDEYGGNVPTLRSGVTSDGQRHTFGWDASPKSGSLPDSGQDCWLATELERWSLVFHKLTAARSRALWAGALSCWKVKKSPERSRMAVDEARRLDNTGRSPLYLDQWEQLTSRYAPDCSQQPTPSDITDREIERVLTIQRHFRTSDCSKQCCVGNRDILSSVFED